MAGKESVSLLLGATLLRFLLQCCRVYCGLLLRFLAVDMLQGDPDFSAVWHNEYLQLDYSTKKHAEIRTDLNAK